MGEIQAQNQKNYLFNAKKTAIRKSNHRVEFENIISKISAQHAPNYR